MYHQAELVVQDSGSSEDIRAGDSSSGNEWLSEAVVTLPIDLILPADSPRLRGSNEEHARVLALSGAVLPPVVVQRGTMRIVDGSHRLRAAEIRGQSEVEVRFFEGSDDEAFIFAVEANIAHGLPLTLADRTAAAVRILAVRQTWSNRRIALAAGVAANTVKALRKRASGQNAQSQTRIGRDGRVRPVNSAERRQLAADLIAEHPSASLRVIAEKAGLSPSTVRDVRGRLLRGEEVIPVQRRPKMPDDRRQSPGEAGSMGSASQDPRSAVAFSMMLRSLRGDPSLRFTDTGRLLLRLFDMHTVGVDDWDRLATSMPAHCSSAAATLARACADQWQQFASLLETREKDV